MLKVLKVAEMIMFILQSVTQVVFFKLCFQSNELDWYLLQWIAFILDMFNIF